MSFKKRFKRRLLRWVVPKPRGPDGKSRVPFIRFKPRLGDGQKSPTWEAKAHMRSAFLSCLLSANCSNKVWRNFFQFRVWEHLFHSGDGFNLKETGRCNFFQPSAGFMFVDNGPRLLSMILFIFGEPNDMISVFELLSWKKFCVIRQLTSLTV